VVRRCLLDHIHHISPLGSLVDDKRHSFVESLVITYAYQHAVAVTAPSGLEDFLSEVRFRTELLRALLHEPAHDSKLPISH
jgi:hypothetical protein